MELHESSPWRSELSFLWCLNCLCCFHGARNCRFYGGLTAYVVSMKVNCLSVLYPRRPETQVELLVPLFWSTSTCLQQSAPTQVRVCVCVCVCVCMCVCSYMFTWTSAL